MNQTLSRLYCCHLPEFSNGRRVIELTQTLWYTFSMRGFSQEVCVPIGFKSDGASIPRCLWPLLPPDEHDEEAVVHDYLYSISVDRWTCDSIFREIMKYKGVPYWKRLLLYWGVRVGGWWAWRKHKKASK